MFPEDGARRPAEQLLAAAVPEDDPVRGIDGEDRFAASRDPIEGFGECTARFQTGNNNASTRGEPRKAETAGSDRATPPRRPYDGHRPARNVDEPQRHAAQDPLVQRVAPLAADHDEIRLNPLRLS